MIEGGPARQDHQRTGVKRVAKGREGRSGVTTRLAVLKARSGETEGLTLDRVRRHKRIESYIGIFVST